jgi:hypothetical protein
MPLCRVLCVFVLNKLLSQKKHCVKTVLSLCHVSHLTLTLRVFFAIVLSSLFRNHRVEFEYLSTQQRFFGIWHNIYLLVSCARQRARERHRGERRARCVVWRARARTRGGMWGESAQYINHKHLKNRNTEQTETTLCRVSCVTHLPPLHALSRPFFICREERAYLDVPRRVCI